MIYDSCSFSSIVFIILGIIINQNVFLRLCFIMLGVSSTLFHMLDHEIDKDHYIHDYMEYIYTFDMCMITLLASFIITKSIVISICIAIVSYDKVYVKNVLYVIGLCKLVYTMISNEPFEIIFLYLAIMVYAIIALLDNHKQYHKPPYHISWQPKNAFIWNTCNFIILYKGLSKW